MLPVVVEVAARRAEAAAAVLAFMRPRDRATPVIATFGGRNNDQRLRAGTVGMPARRNTSHGGRAGGRRRIAISEPEVEVELFLHPPRAHSGQCGMLAADRNDVCIQRLDCRIPLPFPVLFPVEEAARPVEHLGRVLVRRKRREVQHAEPAALVHKLLDLGHAFRRHEMRRLGVLVAVPAVRDDQDRIGVRKNRRVLRPPVTDVSHADRVFHVGRLERRLQQPGRPGVVVDAVPLGAVALLPRDDDDLLRVRGGRGLGDRKQADQEQQQDAKWHSNGSHHSGAFDRFVEGASTAAVLRRGGAERGRGRAGGSDKPRRCFSLTVPPGVSRPPGLPVARGGCRRKVATVRASFGRCKAWDFG